MAAREKSEPLKTSMNAHFGVGETRAAARETSENPESECRYKLLGLRGGRV